MFDAFASLGCSLLYLSDSCADSFRLPIAHVLSRWLFKVVLLIDFLMYFVHYVGSSISWSLSDSKCLCEAKEINAVGWQELALLRDKMSKFSGMIEGLIWSPRSGDSPNT
ncbi:hypothetical protein Bca4012_054252 [Brassica carinata]